MKINKAPIALIAVSTCLTGCTTALTVADFLVRPVGSGIHVYYTNEEIYAPYVKAEKEHTPDLVRNEALSVQKIKWVQPANKRTSCKMPVFYDLDVDRKVYWDGSCENGYAKGIGREIHLGENYHTEVIVSHDHSKTGNYGPFIQMDYFKRTSIRGYFIGNVGSSIKYENIEKIDENKRTGTARFRYEEKIKNLDFESYRTSDQEKGLTLIAAQKNGLTFAKIVTEQKVYNYPTEIIFLGLGNYTLNELMGESDKRILSRFVINDRPEYFWLQNKDRQGIGGIIGSGSDYFLTASKELSSVEKEFDAYYKSCNELENKYKFKLKVGISRPKGVSERIYYEIENFYSDELMRRISVTNSNDLEKRINDSNSRELEQRQQEAAARASNQRTMQMLDQMNNNFQNTGNSIKLNKNVNIETQPMEVNAPSVYHTQRVNDNMAIIKKVK